MVKYGVKSCACAVKFSGSRDKLGPFGAKIGVSGAKVKSSWARIRGCGTEIGVSEPQLPKEASILAPYPPLCAL